MLLFFRVLDAATGRATVQSKSTDTFSRSVGLRFTQQNGELWLIWLPGGELETADDVHGPWTILSNAISPQVVDFSKRTHFFRVNQNIP